MGNGNCCTSGKQKNYKLEDLIKQKNDQQKAIYNEHKPVKLIISNIKMKNLPFTTSRFQVRVLDQSIMSSEICDNKNPIWRPPMDPIEIQKIKSDEDLKEIVVSIKVLTKKKKEVGYVNINLYDVAVGPKRHDFQINWLPSFGNDKNILSRIQFELEFSQKIQIIIKASFIKCYLNQIMPKDSKFKFNLTLISEGFEKRLKDKEDTIFYYDQVKTTNGTDIEEMSLIKKLTQHEEPLKSHQNTYIQQSDKDISSNQIQNQTQNLSQSQQSQKQLQLRALVPEDNEFNVQEISEPSVNQPYQVLENKYQGNSLKKYNIHVKTQSQADKHQLTHEEIKKIREQAEERARITEERLKIQKLQQQQQKEDGSQGIVNQLTPIKQVQLIKWVNKWQQVDDMETFAVVVLNSKDIKESSVKIEIFQILDQEQMAELQYKQDMQLIGQGFIYLHKLFNQKLDKGVDTNSLQYQNSVNLDISGSSSQRSSIMSKSMNNVFKLNKSISERMSDQLNFQNGNQQEQKNVQIFKNVRQFWEKIWLNGEQKGKFGVEFIIRSQTSYLRQMPLRIRTENGIQRNAPNFYIKEEDQNSNSQLRKLSAISATLFSKVFEYQRNQANTIVLLEIEVYLQSLIEIINPKQKNPQLTKGQNATFIYNSTLEKLKGQEQMIEIANHLLNYADEIDESLREKYYMLLKMTLNRGEFDLPEMGFNQKDYGFLLVQNILGNNTGINVGKNSFIGSETLIDGVKNESHNQNSVNNNINNKNRRFSLNKELENSYELELKVKVSLKYYKLLIQCLGKALDKMNDLDKNIVFQQHEKNFVYSFLAQAYFRVHGFREIVLKLIQKDGDPPLIDWRGSDFKLIKQGKVENKQLNTNQQEKQLQGYFDWYNEFYIYIFSIKLHMQKKGDQNQVNKSLELLLEDPEWQEKFAERQYHFYLFLKEWAHFVNRRIITKDYIPWNELPGYQTLIHGFFSDISRRHTIINQYADVWKNAIVKMLNNDRLINLYIYLFYTKTDLNQPKEIVFCFNLINSCFQYMQKIEKKLHNTFESEYFLEGIRRVLMTNHAESIFSVLLCIVNGYLILPVEFKKSFSNFIFGNIFFKLFLHWSYNVRYVFYFLLLFRINHQHNLSTISLILDQVKKNWTKNYENYRKQMLVQEKQSILDEIQKENRMKANNLYIFEKFQFLYITMEHAKERFEQIEDETPPEESELYKNMRQKLLLRKAKKSNTKPGQILGNQKIMDDNNSTSNILSFCNQNNYNLKAYFESQQSYVMAQQKKQQGILKWSIKQTLNGNLVKKQPRKMKSVLRQDLSRFVSPFQKKNKNSNQFDNQTSQNDEKKSRFNGLLKNQSAQISFTGRNKQVSIGNNNNNNNQNIYGGNIQGQYSMEDQSKGKKIGKLNRQNSLTKHKQSMDTDSDDIGGSGIQGLKRQRNFSLNQQQGRRAIDQYEMGDYKGKRKDSKQTQNMFDQVFDDDQEFQMLNLQKFRDTVIGDKGIDVNNMKSRVQITVDDDQQSLNTPRGKNRHSTNFDAKKNLQNFSDGKQNKQENLNNGKNSSQQKQSQDNDYINNNNQTLGRQFVLNKQSFDLNDGQQKISQNNNQHSLPLTQKEMSQEKSNVQKILINNREDLKIDSIEKIYIRNLSQAMKQFLKSIQEYQKWLVTIKDDIQTNHKNILENKQIKMILQYPIPQMEIGQALDLEEEAL